MLPLAVGGTKLAPADEFHSGIAFSQTFFQQVENIVTTKKVIPQLDDGLSIQGIQPVGERIGRERACHQQRAILALHDAGRVVGVLVAGEIADQRGQQVHRSHDAVEMTVFVMHHRHGDFGLLQHAQRVDRVQLVGDHLGLAEQGYTLGCLLLWLVLRL